MGWWAVRPGSQPVQRALLSGNGPGRPAESSALCIQATVDRPVDRWLNAQKSDRWPVDRVVDRQQTRLLIWPATVSFVKPIKGVPMDSFLQDFKRVFGLVLHTYFSDFLHKF